MPLPDGTVHIDPGQVRRFAVRALESLGVPGDHASIVADVLITADLRGIRSHGIARLPYFLSRLSSGILNVTPQMVFTARTVTTGVLDADRGLGIVASRDAMHRAMEMASSHGSGFVAVSRSSHFGYAGYWTALAQRHGFVGISMSNGGGRTAPTFGMEGVLGTNPLSVAIPGPGIGGGFCLDMATSMVAAGKVETAVREGRAVPSAWLHTAVGEPRLDDRGKLEDDFPLLPLGGEGEETGGHKGYGLGLMVEILCGALAGSALTARLRESPNSASSVGHFFGALEVSGFRDPGEVAADMEETFEVIRRARKAPGHDRIFIHGEPEAIAEKENTRLGVAVDPVVSAQMRGWEGRLGIDVAWPAHPKTSAE